MKCKEGYGGDREELVAMCVCSCGGGSVDGRSIVLVRKKVREENDMLSY